jgi:hypothetical protein
MATIINLRKARKVRTRLQKEKQADRNRVEFGRTKAEKIAAQAVRDQEVRHLDGHQLGERAPGNSDCGSKRDE